MSEKAPEMSLGYSGGNDERQMEWDDYGNTRTVASTQCISDFERVFLVAPLFYDILLLASDRNFSAVVNILLVTST